MLKVLCDHLLEKLDLYLDEMAEFLYDEFNMLVSTYTVSRSFDRMVRLRKWHDG